VGLQKNREGYNILKHILCSKNDLEPMPHTTINTNETNLIWRKQGYKNLWL